MNNRLAKLRNSLNLDPTDRKERLQQCLDRRMLEEYRMQATNCRQVGSCLSATRTNEFEDQGFYTPDNGAIYASLYTYNKQSAVQACNECKPVDLTVIPTNRRQNIIQRTKHRQTAQYKAPVINNLPIKSKTGATDASIHLMNRQRSLQ
jgi:hypothetical protein